MKSFWLVKQEPSSYSWSDFVAEGKTSWTGVRNFAARNNLRKMRKADAVLFYHSGDEKAVIAAFSAGVQAAHADLDPLKAADTDVQQQADAIMADGQGVLEGAKSAAGRC